MPTSWENPRLVVLDFDGTLTDIDATAGDYHRLYLEALCQRLTPEQGACVRRAWSESYDGIVQAPQVHAFEFEGKAVAPATADPYLLSHRVAREALGRCQVLGQVLGQVPRLGDTLEVLGETFRTAYQQAKAPLRDGLAYVVAELRKRAVPVFVVTNSPKEKVAARLAEEGIAIDVLGDARKFCVRDASVQTERFRTLPDAVSVAGLERPIFLRRGYYFDALCSLWEKTGATPETTLVAGDIFELDLAMPHALGARIHLMTHGWTVDHEKALVPSLPRASRGATVSSILEAAFGPESHGGA